MPNSNYTLFREFEIGLYAPVISNITVDEMKGAPEAVVKTFSELSEIAEMIEVNEQAIQLSKHYLKQGRFTQRMLSDTLHIATATVYEIDILVSWNFRDIVNLNKIVVYNQVNQKYGYKQIEIRNPREIIHEKEI